MGKLKLLVQVLIGVPCGYLFGLSIVTHNLYALIPTISIMVGYGVVMFYITREEISEPKSSISNIIIT